MRADESCSTGNQNLFGVHSCRSPKFLPGSRFRCENSGVLSFSTQFLPGGVAPDCPLSKLRKGGGILRWTGVVRGYSKMLRRETQRKCGIELLQRTHLPVKPCFRVFAETVCPTHAGTQMPDVQTAQPFD